SGAASGNLPGAAASPSAVPGAAGAIPATTTASPPNGMTPGGAASDTNQPKPDTAHKKKHAAKRRGTQFARPTLVAADCGNHGRWAFLLRRIFPPVARPVALPLDRSPQRSDRNSAAPVTAAPTTIASSTSAADTAGR